MSKSINYYYDTLVKSIQIKKDIVDTKQSKIRTLECRIQGDEERIIQEQVEIDILLEEINFLDQRRKENE